MAQITSTWRRQIVASVQQRNQALGIIINLSKPWGAAGAVDAGASVAIQGSAAPGDAK